MAHLPLVDTHVHFYDLRRDDLRWEWLAPDSVDEIIGNIDGIKALRLTGDEFLSETRFANVSKIVHMQAAIGSGRSGRRNALAPGKPGRSGAAKPRASSVAMSSPLKACSGARYQLWTTSKKSPPSSTANCT